jgi:2-polyprenyl-6-methoxyphenol hydroxylase-like FAD-dependent oxidoreductase
VPQAQFLPFMVERTHAYAGFDVRMGARVRELVRDDAGRVVGVEYTRDGERRVLRADLVVGADGRSSKVRQLSSIVATELGASLDICWIAFPRRAGDPPVSGLDLLTEPGWSLAVLGQGTHWQIGFTIPAGTFPQLRERGVEPLVGLLRKRLAWLGDRIDELTDPGQLTLLPVRITATDRWSEPGLLLIGDAAHVISPVGGNGINQAVVDAAEAANRLVGPLTTEPVDPAAVDAATAEVERVRRPAVDRDQRWQVQVERRTAQRLAAGEARPVAALRLLCRVPGFARWSARRSARALAVPPPVAAIRDARPDVRAPE